MLTLVVLLVAIAYAVSALWHQRRPDTRAGIPAVHEHQQAPASRTPRQVSSSPPQMVTPHVRTNAFNRARSETPTTVFACLPLVKGMPRRPGPYRDQGPVSVKDCHRQEMSLCGR